MRATDVLLRRVRHFQLTTKNGPKDYYKGTRTGAMGQHTHKGGYKVDFEKVRTYVVPAGLSEFKVIQPCCDVFSSSNGGCGREILS